MDESGFWQLIDEARTAVNGDQDKVVEYLKTALAALPVEEIFDFQFVLDLLCHRADTWDLLGAAILICSPGDDGWHDFRAWLIAQGKNVYDKALVDAESLVDIADTIHYHPELNFYEAELELMLYVPFEAFHLKTGMDYDEAFDEFAYLADPKRGTIDYSVRREDSSRPWDWSDDDALERYLPRLAARFPNPNQKPKTDN